MPSMEKISKVPMMGMKHMPRKPTNTPAIIPHDLQDSCLTIKSRNFDDVCLR